MILVYINSLILLVGFELNVTIMHLERQTAEQNPREERLPREERSGLCPNL
jgi:uncharacterized BrkB/YihY/UPF0761 family membrane protein